MKFMQLLSLVSVMGTCQLRADVASLFASINAAKGTVMLNDGTVAPEEIVLSRSVKAGETHWEPTNRGDSPVRISQVVFFDAAHTLSAETRIRDEGFTKLSQTAGTLAKPEDLERYTGREPTDPRPTIQRGIGA